MSGWRSEKVSTIREEFDEINDSMKGSSSRMKNKVGAQKGALSSVLYIFCLYFIGLNDDLSPAFALIL